jgi:uroporphyrinogen decarboxylase
MIGWVGFASTELDINARYRPYHRLAPGARWRDGDSELRTGDARLNESGTALIAGSDTAYDHYVPPAVMVEADTLKAFEDYPLPDWQADYRHAHLENAVADIKAKGLAAVAGLEMTIWEVAWQIRGFERIMLDFFEREDFAACLLDRITEGSVFRARRFAQAGCDIIRTGDDVGMEDRLMMSPAVWRKFLKPRLARVFAAAKDAKPDVLIFYHSDGYIEPLIDDLIEIGMDVLNPVQPECMDPAALKQRYGRRLSFWGTMGIQHTLPFGTPEDVAAEVRLRIETVAKGGGLLLSPTHVLAPEVPHENIRAMVTAARKYGNW